MKRRTVTYRDIGECISDLEILRRGYASGGSWTLAQACWHLNFPIELMKDEEPPPPTVEQQKKQKFIDQVIASGWPESGGNSPDPMVPPQDVGDETISAFISSLRRLSAMQSKNVEVIIFGPIDRVKILTFFLIHTAHHLSFFQPTTTGS